MIDIGHPHMEWRRREFERQARHHEHQAQHQHHLVRGICRNCLRDLAQFQRTRGAVDHRHTVQHET